MTSPQPSRRGPRQPLLLPWRAFCSRLSSVRAASLALPVACLLACRGGEPTSPESQPSVPTTPVGRACSVHNRPPSVTLAALGETHCHPHKTQPCALGVRADASDPDGDQLAYTWSGCAQGQGSEAVCSVTAPGRHVAVLEITDGCGGSAAASVEFEGTNQPPVFQGFYSDPAPQPWGFAVANDPEDGFCWGVSLKDCHVEGACRLRDCRKLCLSSSIEFSIDTDPGPGTCTLSMTVEDEWGLSDGGSTTFEW